MSVPVFHFRAVLTALVALAGIVGVTTLGGLPARAEGTVRIQQADGSVDVYRGVKIRVVQKSLTVTSADGKGTMIVYRAACMYQGEVMMCLPTGVTLVQGGSVSPIKLKSGTVYANLTADPHTLARSSTQLPANGVLLSLKTQRGTYISLSGTIDTVSK